MNDVKVYRVSTGIAPHPELVSNLIMAMRHGLTVLFIYDGKTRIVEPHAIGLTSNGVALRGYQVAGQASRPLPQWTLFSLDKFEGLGAAFMESFAPRDGYKMGDKQMTEIIAELVV